MKPLPWVRGSGEGTEQDELSVSRQTKRQPRRVPVLRSKDGQIHAGRDMLDPSSAKEVRAAGVPGNPAARGNDGKVGDVVVSLLPGAKAATRKILLLGAAKNRAAAAFGLETAGSCPDNGSLP